MYIYLSKFPNHSKGGYYYYVGKRERTPESSKSYYGSGRFCKNYVKRYGKKYVRENVKKIILMSNIPNRKALCYWEQVHIKSYREQYGDRVVNWTDGGEGGCGEGEKNPHYDHNIYTFRNVRTNQVFTGTQYLFSKKYNVNQRHASRLVNGKRNHYKYWVINDKIKSVADIKRKNPLQYDVNSVHQIYQRAYKSGDIKTSHKTFYIALKNPNHKRHLEFTKLRDKHTIKEATANE